MGGLQISQRQQKCETKLHSLLSLSHSLTHSVNDVSTDCLETKLMYFELWRKKRILRDKICRGDKTTDGDLLAKGYIERTMGRAWSMTHCLIVQLWKFKGLISPSTGGVYELNEISGNSGSSFNSIKT